MEGIETQSEDNTSLQCDTAPILQGARGASVHLQRDGRGARQISCAAGTWIVLSCVCLLVVIVYSLSTIQWYGGSVDGTSLRIGLFELCVSTAMSSDCESILPSASQIITLAQVCGIGAGIGGGLFPLIALFAMLRARSSDYWAGRRKRFGAFLLIPGLLMLVAGALFSLKVELIIHNTDIPPSVLHYQAGFYASLFAFLPSAIAMGAFVMNAPKLQSRTGGSVQTRLE